ncbi:hypothetical protein [Thermoactinomyces sp. DSM 45892]|uniref:hypothetical protein n=1 Tax=Thermoactinomyces sp. DSM 45892 TaxID=1882753 RepID=UPI000898A942|nr:hypothetical protein [Thermoactinomyces sp. DSM 45892]SDY03678.1 hypothetical protein SAMN05444416_101299 [Thermoactinomyces sp. DSM 45892]
MTNIGMAELTSMHGMSEMLLRYHRIIGMNHEQLILLQASIQLHDAVEIEEATGFSRDTIAELFSQISELGVIRFNERNELDYQDLFETLKSIEKRSMPFRERLTREYSKASRTNQKHVGHVELVPVKKGVAVKLMDGTFLSIKQTKDLSNELMMFAQSMKEEDLQRFNRNVEQKKDKGQNGENHYEEYED